MCQEFCFVDKAVTKLYPDISFVHRRDVSSTFHARVLYTKVFYRQVPSYQISPAAAFLLFRVHDYPSMV